MRRKRVGRQQARLLLTALWCVVAPVYLFPYIWMVLTGIRQPVDTLAMRWVFTPTLDGFRSIFNESAFQTYLLNSIVVSVLSTLLVLAAAAPAAYSLAHLRTQGRVFLSVLLLAHVLDTYGVLVVIYTAFNLPFAIWLLRGFFREVPHDVREAAMLDGCTEWQVFWRVMLPLMTGGMVATGVFVFIAAWNEFLFALALTQSQAATAPLSVVGFRNEYGVQWGAIGAAALLISTPIVVFAVAMQRYLVRGLTMGSVKG